jgi:hypothetical protein
VPHEYLICAGWLVSLLKKGIYEKKTKKPTVEPIKFQALDCTASLLTEADLLRRKPLITMGYCIVYGQN